MFLLNASRNVKTKRIPLKYWPNCLKHKLQVRYLQYIIYISAKSIKQITYCTVLEELKIDSRKHSHCIKSLSMMPSIKRMDFFFFFHLIKVKILLVLKKDSSIYEKEDSLSSKDRANKKNKHKPRIHYVPLNVANTKPLKKS